MKNGKYTISDVAQKAGVSPSTISRVLNNRSGVGSVLQQKIKDIIDELNYKPNILARSFSVGTIKIIGLILGDIRNPFYADLAFNLQKHLDDAGYILVPYNSEFKTSKEIEYIEKCSQYNFAGLMLITMHSKAIANAIRELKMPILLINRMLPNYTGDVVSSDSFQGGYMATKHLVDLGHESIAFLTSKIQLVSTMQRFQGYRQFLENHHLLFFDRWVFYGDLSMQSGYEIANKYAANIQNLPKAVVVADDIMAIGFINRLAELGIKVPEMLSVIGYDNISFGSLANINLTTIDQKIEEMSKHAARLILKRIENPDAQVERIILEPRLIIRNTTARYNGT
jgi:DNA-binding LacI/PurR family transcriptional regulator